ncbi:sensor domain-containing diguanylate cyclase [Billgrantia azerbaijanica]|nr:sensor domain-containing diguanylate cyclase [Halomonas azerbaijanica]
MPVVGHIQPCGWLLVLDAECSRLLRASANLTELSGLTLAESVAAGPERLLGRRLMVRLRRDLKGRARLPGPLIVQRELAGRLTRLQVHAHRHGERAVVEIEPMPRQGRRRLMGRVTEWLRVIAESESPEVLLDTLAAGVAELTDLDRVVVCRFDADWHGKVVAERLAPGGVSLLGQHFPASDFPPQARSQLEHSPVRSVPDMQAAPVAVVDCRGSDGDPRDELAGSVLRAPSREQVSYQERLGVGALLSIALQDQQGLWGLVIGHGMAARPLSPAVRDAARAVVQMGTQRLFLLKARQDARYRQRVQESRDLLSRERSRLPSPGQLIRRHGETWLALFQVQGLALAHEGQLTACGLVPNRKGLDGLVARLDMAHDHEGPWYTQALGEHPLGDGLELGAACGLLAVPLRLRAGARDWLLLFRHEQVETLVWAVAPGEAARHTAVRAPLPGRHTAWREEVSGRSLAWQRIERLAAMDLGEDLALALSAYEIDRLNQRLHHEQAALAEANAQLEQLAHFDSLTGVWNRYRVEQAIDAELAAAERYGRRFALLLLDADHFKRINDDFGHEMGDRVLRAVAQCVAQSLRGCDHLGRWGGEEFVVLATETDATAAAGLAERLRRLIADMTVEGLPQPVTASIGVAAWSPGDTRKRLVQRADRAMYEAKRAGRNRICLAPVVASAGEASAG